MEPGSSTIGQTFLHRLRSRRAELRESMNALEYALAAPSAISRVRWAERVHVALVELSADMREHISITEGADGLYRELRTKAPRLADAVARLTSEHVLICDQLEDLLAHLGQDGVDHDVGSVREQGTVLLGDLVRHRQRGSDLVYEAYQVDIGGEN